MKVYEVDKGWGFDGAYIPHYAELNWNFFGDPVDNKQTQKLRVHGLSKGRASLAVSVSNIEADNMDYENEFTDKEIINIPRDPVNIKEELYPATNYADSANRGIGMKIKFDGVVENMTKPEPPHVLQVLITQTTTSGHREN